MIDWPDAARQGAFLAGGLNLVLLAALLLSRRWWVLPGESFNGPDAPATAETTTAAAPPRPSVHLSPQAFWLALAAIVTLAAVLRVPLARSSLWWDEIWQARHATVGDWRPDKKNPGELRFRETTWAQAFWNYRKPTNHPPMSATSKVCHEVWKKLTDAPSGAFSEWVLRLPGMAASLAGLVLMALLMRAWGMPVGGLVAALFLTVHPWHIRYGIDNRGYTFLIPLTLLGLWALWRACGPPARDHTAAAPAKPDARAALAHAATPGASTPGAAWWVFGFTQALILWAHLLSIWVCLALCATGAWWIWHHHAGRDRWRRLARLVAVQVAGAMVFFQLFLPNLIQALEWGEKNQDGRLLDAAGIGETLMDAAVGRPSLGWTITVLTVAGLGLILACRGRVPAGAALVALFLSAAGLLAAIWLSGFFYYPRFLFAVVVPLALTIGIFCDQLPRQLRTMAPSFSPWVGRLAVLGCLAALGVGLAAGLPRVVHGSFSPLRETAGILRVEQSAGADIFGYGFGAEALQYYLPTLPYARESDAPRELADAMESARAAGRPLLVATGYEALNRLALPEGFERLDDPSQFTEIWNHTGMESQFAYRIRKFDPSSKKH